jgi:hypothetical protein
MSKMMTVLGAKWREFSANNQQRRQQQQWLQL